MNIAYAVIEGLRQQVPRKEWNGAKAEKAEKVADIKKAEKAEKPAAKKAPAKKVAKKETK